MKGPKALLALADGTVFEGVGFGARGERAGEVVFNTSITGYQEIYSDPSYKGQIVTLTYTQIGNVGTNPEDFESEGFQVEGVIVREYFDAPSNFRSTASLSKALEERGIVGIQGLDTRKLVRHIRDVGAQMGVLSTEDLDPASLVQKAKKAPGLVGRDLVKEVTCRERYAFEEGTWTLGKGYEKPSGNRYHAVAMDFGIKRNILRNLVDSGFKVTVVPATARAEEILKLSPDGIFLSNGPGDPEGLPYAAETVASLLGKKPIFGICLGHQILALSMGARTYKLKFGHRGGNHPVKDLSTGKIEISSQNHGFAVDLDSMKETPLELTHINLNDRTSEGMRHKELPVFSVQYHPEASPGPHDSRYLFERFAKMVEKHK